MAGIGSAPIAAGRLIQSLLGEAEEAGRALPGWAETSLALLILAMAAGLLIAAAMRSTRRAGLFSLAAAGTFGLSMYLAIIAGPFFRHDLALWAAPLGLVYSGLIHAYLRRSGRSPLVPIAAAGALNLASLILAHHVWSRCLAAQGRSSPVVPLIIPGTVLLLSGPTMG